MTEILERRSPELSALVTRDEIVAAIADITDAVPADVETGWHLCYGDTGQSTEGRETHHFVEPQDLGVLVAFANDVAAKTRREINWIHVPVPRERQDDAYFAPLSSLRLKSGTRLFLGLVHQYDGIEGAKRRIEAARRHYPDFGVGTECGMGRRKPEDVPALLRLHHEIARVLQDQ